MDARKNPEVSGDQGSGPALFQELRLRLEDPDWSTWTDSEFEDRAIVAFAHQFEACEPYRALCHRRGITPEGIGAWEDIPFVPATAFKYFDFLSEAATDGQAGLFLTSGTTRGGEARGRHHVPSLDLYRASLAEPFRRALLPEIESGGVERALFLSLIPSQAEAPDSSLSFMVSEAAARFAEPVVWLVDGDGGWQEGAARTVGKAVEEASRVDAPVVLLGTALSFVHLLEAAEEGGSDVATALATLPEGARAMETGGFKGAGRSVSREALYQGIERVTGIRQDHIVNEYGMTELLSQLYAGGLSSEAVMGPAGSGLHRPPPWLAVRALDPTDLTPLPDGRDGVLAFFDLANLGSICHVLTEDVGSVHAGGVRLRGRALGAEPRGCSRAMDDLMSAARG